MASTELRDRARLLRASGVSLNEITEQLQVPKSTARYWCRDIILSEAQQQHLFEKRKLGGIRAAEVMRKTRLDLMKNLIRKGINDVGKLAPRELFLIGVALYWAEGYRKGDGEFGFTNSDPAMIKVILKWLHESCSIPRDRIYLRICINAV